MSLPHSPNAQGGPVRVREISGNVVEICDGLGRKRLLQFREGKVVRMETTIVGGRGLHERVDQRKESGFVSAFVEPGRMPRVVSWCGEILVRVDRGLINYVSVDHERMYETADGRIVQERSTRAGAQVFAWFDREGRVRSKQIHDAAGKRHFLAYDRIGLAKIRLDDGVELTRGVYGLWETEQLQPVRKLELMEDGSIRWSVDRSIYEVRGDGTRAVRIEEEDYSEFARYDADGNLELSIRSSSDPTGAEKTVIRDSLGIASIRIGTPLGNGEYDLQTIERAEPGLAEAARLEHMDERIERVA